MIHQWDTMDKIALNSSIFSEMEFPAFLLIQNSPKYFYIFQGKIINNLGLT